MTTEIPNLRDLKLCRAKALKAVEQTASTYSEDPAVEFDRNHAFELYATFCGDVERTAHALGSTPVEVLKMAQDGNWMGRLKAIIELKKSKRPGDVERAINRAMNFVQAHRIRMFLERLIGKLCAMNDAELLQYCLAVEEAKDGTITRRITARPFAELVAALEKAHMLSYYALGDTAGERVKRSPEESDEPSASEIHRAISEAMKAAGCRSPEMMISDEQSSRAEQLTREKAAPGQSVPHSAPNKP